VYWHATRGVGEVRGLPRGMGMMLAKLWSSFFGLEEFKILIVGLNNAGKTTTLYKLYVADDSCET
jgi:hypothetical protein